MGKFLNPCKCFRALLYLCYIASLHCLPLVNSKDAITEPSVCIQPWYNRWFENSNNDKDSECCIGDSAVPNNESKDGSTMGKHDWCAYQQNELGKIWLHSCTKWPAHMADTNARTGLSSILVPDTSNNNRQLRGFFLNVGLKAEYKSKVTSQLTFNYLRPYMQTHGGGGGHPYTLLLYI